MTPPSITEPVAAVVFDFGGVLSNDPFKAMASVALDHGFDLPEFATIAIGRGDYGSGGHPWHQLERGEIEVAEYEEAVNALAKQRGHAGFPPLPVDLLVGQALTVRPAMLELLSELRSGGIGTAILTNNVRALGAWRKSADWDHLVDAVIDSCEVGMRKPEPRIYAYACDQLETTTARTVFLDDMQVNVDAAAATGMTGVLVTDPAEAIATVKQLVDRRHINEGT